MRKILRRIPHDPRQMVYKLRNRCIDVFRAIHWRSLQLLMFLPGYLIDRPLRAPDHILNCNQSCFQPLKRRHK